MCGQIHVMAGSIPAPPEGNGRGLFSNNTRFVQTFRANFMSFTIKTAVESLLTTGYTASVYRVGRYGPLWAALGCERRREDVP